jgi:chaperone BCS1
MVAELSEAYQALLKSNPLIGQALPLAFAGVFGYVFRSLPLQIWGMIVRQATTSITLLSTGAGSTDMQYFSFQRWFRQKGFLKWSRSLAVESTWTWRLVNGGGDDADGQISAGDGRHYFFFGGRLCWLSKSRIESGGTTNEITHSITVTMVGRSHSKLTAAVDEFRWKPLKGVSNLYHCNADGSWATQRQVTPRKMETVILNGDTKETILERIQWFLDNRPWFVDRGLPYKLVILFYGPPGTGKSSLLRALAYHFKRNLCPINLASLTDDALSTVIRSVPDASLVVIEDFDSCQAVLKSEYKKEDGLPEGIKLSKTGVLQALDGIDTLDGQIIIMTTNYLEKIEPSIIREERVNEMFFLGPLTNDAVHAYITQMFPHEHELTTVEFAPVVGSVLQKLYKQHHQNYRDFITSIPVVNPDTVSEPQQETV